MKNKIEEIVPYHVFKLGAGKEGGRGTAPQTCSDKRQIKTKSFERGKAKYPERKKKREKKTAEKRTLGRGKKEGGGERDTKPIGQLSLSLRHIKGGSPEAFDFCWPGKREEGGENVADFVTVMWHEIARKEGRGIRYRRPLKDVSPLVGREKGGKREEGRKRGVYRQR